MLSSSQPNDDLKLRIHNHVKALTERVNRALNPHPSHEKQAADELVTQIKKYGHFIETLPPEERRNLHETALQRFDVTTGTFLFSMQAFASIEATIDVPVELKISVDRAVEALVGASTCSANGVAGASPGGPEQKLEQNPEQKPVDTKPKARKMIKPPAPAGLAPKDPPPVRAKSPREAAVAPASKTPKENPKPTPQTAAPVQPDTPPPPSRASRSNGVTPYRLKSSDKLKLHSKAFGVKINGHEILIPEEIAAYMLANKTGMKTLGDFINHVCAVGRTKLTGPLGYLPDFIALQALELLSFLQKEVSYDRQALDQFLQARLDPNDEASLPKGKLDTRTLLEKRKGRGSRD